MVLLSPLKKLKVLILLIEIDLLRYGTPGEIQCVLIEKTKEF